MSRHPQHPAPQHQQRRTFRGRGGPTDRRLPKHNAARRRPTRPPEEDPPVPSSVSSHSHAGLERVEEPSLAAASQSLAMDLLQHPDDEATNSFSVVELIETEDDDIPDDNKSDEETASQPSSAAVAAAANQDSCFHAEIHHLRTRIRHNRASMSLSTTALANPATYKTNVLAACQNTIREWRSIRRRYCGCGTSDNQWDDGC